MSPTLYVDCRSLQDLAFRHRGVGQHAAALLRARVQSNLRHLFSIALVDPKLPPLSAEIVALFDKVTFTVNPTFNAPVLFLDVSPMTHDSRLTSRFVGRPGLFKASVVYDFIPYDRPGYLNSTPARIEYLSSMARLKTASRFFPISHYAAKRLVDVLGILEADIVVTGAAVRARLYDIAQGTAAQSADGSRASQGYFVTLGGSDTRKNTIAAVTAVSALRRQTGRDYRLIVIGDYPEEQKASLLSGSSVESDSIEFLRDISDESMVALYRNAIASICPSHIEGFSLPVVESAICGCPVLASSCAAHAELLTDISALFSSRRPEELTAKLARIAGDEPWRAQILSSQSTLVSQFHEQTVGKRFWDGVAAGTETAFAPDVYVIRGLKPSIAFLTPYPPDASGVARFAEGSLRALGKCAEIDIYTNALRPLRVHPGTRDAGRINAAPYQSSRYESVVAVLGNSHYHYVLFDLFDRYGGPCILHDSRLTHAYHDKLGEDAFLDMASALLNRAVDPGEIRRWLEDNNPPTWFVETVLERASPLIVHTRRYAGLLYQRYGFQASVAVFPPNQEFTPEQLTDRSRAAARQRLGLPSGHLVLSHFGYLTDTKGIDVCVDAVRRLRRLGTDVHLYLVGNASAWQEGLKTIANAPDVSSYVHTFADYVDERTYRDFLIATDVAVQLRSYDYGQPSAALADCISAGIPTVANCSLAEACEAPQYVQAINDSFDSQAVAQAVELCASARNTPDIFSQREEYVSRHNFETYARQIVAALGL